MPDFAAELELSTLDGSNGFRVDGETPGDRSAQSVASAGDVNGDGYEDFIIGAPLSSVHGLYAGAAYLVFGGAGGFPPSFSLADLDGTNGFRIRAAAPYGQIGWSVASAGDVNGDGYDDLLIGSNVSTNGPGDAYVVFGKAGGFGAEFDLAGLDGANGFVIHGATRGDGLGAVVAAGGDINGDGYDDLLVSAAQPDGGAGASYVVFGKAGGFDPSLSVTALDGANGFRIHGGAAGDGAAVVSSAGDVNGDGFDDLFIGAPGVDFPNDYSGAGYVLFGRQSGFNADFSLSDVDGTNGFRVDFFYGSLLGAAVASAGDLNNDGYGDIVISSPYMGPPNRSGVSFVVFGRAGGFGAHIDLAALDGTSGFRITSGQIYDYSGVRVASAGDFNGDGFDDLLVGASGHHTNAFAAGATYLIFGKAGGFGDIDLSSLDGNNGFRVDGEGYFDAIGTALGAGDINGDGYDDLILGAGGSGGEATYVVFGHAAGAAPVVWTGGAGDETHNGGALGDRLSGGGGRDILNGFAGDDTLNGDNGEDKLNGGTGKDHLNGGAGADQLDGGDGDDVLDGGADNDSLQGGKGADVMTGGAGNDVFYVDNAGDQTLEAAGQGSDIVRATLSWTLSANIETLQLQGAGDLDGTGNGLANNLQGNDGANVLSGLAGVDTINGGGGADSLIGGTGNDLMTGGKGADTFVVLGESVYSSKAPAGRALEIDFVYDLNKADGDRLDLSAIDANTATGADDAFHLVAAFGKHAGEMVLAYTASSNITLLSLDVDGDGKADYQMKITGDVRLDSGGWLL